ncbi:hypothetical protein BY996DRAFT_6417662 [Phakopsora pachyrhizi]|nr:hypothetical protein BY996DRAFT_6417662 [Phakopsora pachyrhizi]
MADSQPLPAGWVKEWDASHNAWYYVDTRQNPPATTWNDPRFNSAAAGGTADRGLMSSIGGMLSGGQKNNSSYPQQNTGYGGYPTQQQPHPYPTGGEASSYYSQPNPQGSPYQAPPQQKPSGGGGMGGLGGLISKLPGGLTGGGGGGGGSSGGGGGGKQSNPLMSALGGAGAGALAMKLVRLIK